MKIHGSLYGDGDRHPDWMKIELTFTLPDGKVLKLESPFDHKILSAGKQPSSRMYQPMQKKGLPKYQQNLIPQLFTSYEP